MIVLSGALVLVALVLLVFGAVDRNLPYVYASIGVSLLSLLLLVVGILQRRGELPDDEDAATTPVTDTSDERVPALVGAGDTQVEPAPAPVQEPVPVQAPAPVQEPVRPASRRVEPDSPVEVQEPEDWDDEPVDVEEPVDEPEEELEDDGLDEGSGVTVLVVSGRPRYHLEGCRVLRGKEPQPLDRDDARTHGFSPCGVCKPDADETAAAPTGEDGVSFTEALFGEPLFADGPARDAEAAEAEEAVAEPTGTEPVDAEATDAEPVEAPPAEALPDRPVQPVLVEVEPERTPATAPAEDVEPPLLQGEDPADDPTPAPAADDHLAEPAPDVAGDPDELAQASLDDEAPSTDEQPGAGVQEPAVEPVAAEHVPVTTEPAAAEAPSEEVEAAAPVRSRRKRPASPAEPRTAPAEDAPAATRAPAKKAPAKRAPAKKAPAKKAAAKAAPAEPAPAPQVRRPVVRAVRADALRLGAPATGVTTTKVSARAAAPAAPASVVVVPDRDRFHRPQCRFVRDVAGATTLPKASAARQGYAACGVCKP